MLSMVVSEVGTVEMGTKLRHMVLQNLEALRVTFRAADPKGSGQLLMGVRCMVVHSATAT